MKMHPAITKSIVLIAVAFMLFTLPGLKIPYVDQKADAYFSNAMTKAVVAYGVCRVINASVSVIKESQISVEPWGIGGTLALGQVLDPLDDMTERVSDILVTAIVSLGIQKIVYELTVAFSPGLFGMSLIALVAVSCFKGDRAKALRSVILNSVIIIAAARLCLPTSSIVSFYLNDHYFSPQIDKTKRELMVISPVIDRLKSMDMSKVDDILESKRKTFKFVKQRTTDLKELFVALYRNMRSLVSNLLKLSTLYVALFLIQVIILPIGTFWLLVRLTNGLCGANIPYILKHADLWKALKGGTESKKV